MTHDRGASVEQVSCDAVVIGAGLAGLSCAVALQDAGASVCVLEADSRLGGRVRSDPRHAPALLEVGGQWASARHTELLGLAAQHGVETMPTPHEGADLADWDGRLRRFEGAFETSPEGHAAYRDVCAQIERIAAEVDLERPERSPRAEALDGETFLTWLRRTTSSVEARRRVRVEIEGLLAAEVGAVSALHVAFFVASNGGLEHLLDTEGGAQELRFVGGAARIAESLAARLEGCVALSDPVRAISQDARRVTAASTRRTVRARHAVIAVPPTMAGRIHYEPALPVVRDALTQRMAQGSVVKGLATYRRAFWRRRGSRGCSSGIADPWR